MEDGRGEGKGEKGREKVGKPAFLDGLLLLGLAGRGRWVDGFFAVLGHFWL